MPDLSSKSKLNVNAGVRYEFPMPVADSQQPQANQEEPSEALQLSDLMAQLKKL